MDPQQSLPPEIVSAVERGHLIEAIRLARAYTCGDLKQSKGLIDAYRAGKPLPLVRSAAGLPADETVTMTTGSKTESLRIERKRPDLGSVEDSSKNRWLLLLLVLAIAGAAMLYSRR
jgi:hypothetical protein